MRQVAPHCDQLSFCDSVDVYAVVADLDPLFVGDIKLIVAEFFLILLVDNRVW
jgi:hypothetical protein